MHKHIVRRLRLAKGKLFIFNFIWSLQRSKITCTIVEMLLKASLKAFEGKTSTSLRTTIEIVQKVKCSTKNTNKSIEFHYNIFPIIARISRCTIATTNSFIDSLFFVPFAFDCLLMITKCLRANWGIPFLMGNLRISWCFRYKVEKERKGEEFLLNAS